MGEIVILDSYLDEAGGARNVSPRLGGRPYRIERPAHEPGWRLALGGADAVVVTGSAASVTTAPPAWAVAVVDGLRGALARDVPILGICFGHQALAEAAAPGSVRRSPTPELGWLPVERIAPDPLLDALPSRFAPFISHRDEVTPAPGLVPLARSAGCAVQALRIPGRRAWGVQFHAEMDEDEAAGIVRSWAADEEEARAILEGAASGAAWFEALLARFLERVDET